jgi:pimeloyl-ACP methyl ester carboxylesterase
MASLFRAAGAARADTLLIFLPGRRDRAEVFAQEGFLDAPRRHGWAADVIAADAHLGYYLSGSMVSRLHQDLVAPARKRGYRRIILVGVSMGGYGAVRYAMAHPNQITALVLLSPFLGAGPFQQRMAEAGDEDFKQTWDWLKRYAATNRDDKRAAEVFPRIILGYGHEDLFLLTNLRLRALLPADDVLTTFGAHLWSTFRALFDKLLEKKLLDAEPSP